MEDKQVHIVRINRRKKTLAMYKEHWDEIPVERKPYQDMGLQSQGIAISNLLLGNLEEGLFWFGESAKYFISSVESARKIYTRWESEVGVCVAAFNMSVLSQDEKLLKKSVDLVLQINPRHPDIFPDPANTYYYMTAMAKNLLGDTLSAKKLIEKAKTTRRHKGFEKLEEGRIQFAEGIINHDAALCLTGAQNIQLFQSKQHPSQSDDYLMNIHLTTFLLLARRANITISIKDEHIPEILFKED